MADSGRIVAPWTAEQVEALNRFQVSGVFHPFTCGNDECRAKTHGEPLVATADGWRCNHCDYRQDWAHVFMAGRFWQDAGRVMRRALGLTDTSEV